MPADFWHRAERAMEWLIGRYGSFHRIPPTAPVVAGARALFRAARQQRERPAHQWSVRLYAWVLLLWRQLEEDDSASLPGPAIVSNSRLMGLSHPNFKSFARAMGYNPAYLSRSIKKSWDSKSPAALLRAGRLQVAEGLLRTGNLSVRQIARAVRYSGPNAFAAAFKRCYGMTPLRYRQTFRLGAAP